MRTESRTFVSAGAPACARATSCSHRGGIEKFGVPRIGLKQIRLDRAPRVAVDPTRHGPVEEADLGLVDHPVGDQASDGLSQDVLRLASDAP